MACNGHHPRVAVVAIISDEQGRIVAGRRIGPLGPGQWAFPGGHLDYGEEIMACVERETVEETGLVVRGVKIVGTTNDLFTEANKHYITLFAKCVRRLEPNKCEGWNWKTWDEIKELAAKDGGRELFLPVANLVRENPRIDVTVTAD